MKSSTAFLSCALSVVACGGSDRRPQDASSQTTVTSATYEVAPAPRSPTAAVNASPPGDTPGSTATIAPRVSAKIIAEIRRSIASDSTLSVGARSVRVSDSGGKVRLRGTVESDAERAKVEKHARLVTGVTDVRNEVEVRR